MRSHRPGLAAACGGLSRERTRRWVVTREQRRLPAPARRRRNPCTGAQPADSVGDAHPTLAAARGDGSPRTSGHPGAALAAARAGHRHRDLGQAREPQPDRRLQGPRRARLRGPPLAEPDRCPRPGRRQPRQPRPEPRVRRPRRTACRSRSWCPRATPPTRTPRPRPTAPSWSSTAATSRRRVEHAAALAAERGLHAGARRSTPGWSRASRRTPPSCTRRCPGSTSVYVPVGMGSGHLRQHRRPRPARARHRDRRRRRRAGPGVCPVLRRPAAGGDPDRRHVRRRRRLPDAGPRRGRDHRAGAARIVRVSEEQVADGDGADVPHHPQPRRAGRVAGPGRGCSPSRTRVAGHAGRGRPHRWQRDFERPAAARWPESPRDRTA